MIADGSLQPRFDSTPYGVDLNETAMGKDVDGVGEASPCFTEVAAASLDLVNKAVAEGKARAGWLRNSAGSFVQEVLQQAEQTLKTYEEVSPPSAHALRFLIEQLRMARRLRIGVPLVPGKASLEMPATMQAHALGLVYSSAEPLAIEYEHAGVYDASADLTHALSTRRLALVIPLDSEFALDIKGMKGFEREQNDHGAVMVWSINYFEEKHEWEFAPTAAVIPRFQAIEYLKASMGSLTRAERIASKLRDCLSEFFLSANSARQASTQSSSGAGPGDPIAVQYQDMLPELIRQLSGDLMRRISRELSMDACWVALGAMNALACTNVELLFDESSSQPVERPMVSVKGESSENVRPVDPFHGRVVLDWRGSWNWEQA